MKIEESIKQLEDDLLEAELVTEDQLDSFWLKCEYSGDTLKDYFEILYKKWLDNFDLETITENLKDRSTGEVSNA